MTTQLSGCRFVITESRVMHVASDVLGAGPEDSRIRDKAELPLVDGARTVRRMSFTALEGYRSVKKRELNGRALVFGMRTPSGWVYKALWYTTGSTEGTWVTLYR
jgi:hypothetical protein